MVKKIQKGQCLGTGRNNCPNQASIGRCFLNETLEWVTEFQIWYYLNIDGKSK